MTITLRTQQILAEETGVINTIDPLAGSYFVEALTDKLEEEAMKYIEKIEERGPRRGPPQGGPLSFPKEVDKRGKRVKV